MTAKRKWCIGILCLALLSVICGCTSAPQNPPAADPTLAHAEALKLYNSAKYQLLEAEHRVLHYESTLSYTVSGQTFLETAKGVATFSNVHSGEMTAALEETLTYGALTAENRAFYQQGNVYNLLNGSMFSAEMTAADFAEYIPPAPLLDAAIYRTLTTQQTEGITRITFSQPIKLESWAAPSPDARLTEATGTALVDAAGNLLQCDYRAQFTCGDAAFDLTVTLQLHTPEQAEAAPWSDAQTAQAIPVTDLRIPKMLLRAAGAVFTATELSGQATETIVSEAISAVRQRVSHYRLSSLDTVTAAMEHTVTLTDYRNQTLTTKQSYSASAGNCFSTFNDQMPVLMPDITPEQLHEQVEDAILAGLFAPHFITSAVLTETEDAYILTFSGNETYCTDLSADICAFLELDLDNLADSLENLEATGALTLSKRSVLPVSMEMTFVRNHIFGDVPYQLRYTLQQTLSFSPDAE